MQHVINKHIDLATTLTTRIVPLLEKPCEYSTKQELADHYITEINAVEATLHALKETTFKALLNQE